MSSAADGRPLAADDPGETENERGPVRVDRGAEPLDGLYRDAGLLHELAAQSVQGQLGLLEEASRKVPVAFAWLDAAAADQHPAVTNEQPLNRGLRVRPVAGSAAGAVEMGAVERFQLIPAARAKLPALEIGHRASLSRPCTR